MTPGQAAFERWVQLLDRPYPLKWGQLKAGEKQAWEDIAVAAIEARNAQRNALTAFAGGRS